MKSSRPTFSIIIPVKEINDYLQSETIPAILAQSYQNFEIIVLPDRKSPEKFPKTKIIPTWPRTGPADKRDAGAKIARGEVLAFLDDDSYPDKNWLKNALLLFKLPETAGVGGPSLTPPQDNIFQKASGYVWSTWLGSGGAGAYRCSIRDRQEVDDYPTVNLFVKREDFWKVDGFDSHFWPGEDTKLCLDLIQKLGKKIIYDPDVLVYHHRRAVFGPHLEQISRYAVHRGHFARILPQTSMRLGYLSPTLFSLGLVFGPVLFLVHPFFKSLYFVAVVLYIIALSLTSINVYLKEKNFKLSLLLIPSIFLTHFIYGLLFIKGFLSPRLTS